MNLLDRWIHVRRRSGNEKIIAPWQIAVGDDPAVAILTPRADFTGALYQLLIGMVQTLFAPEDHTEWKALWNHPPAPEILKSAFEKRRDAFEIDSDGPAFMQDYDLPDGESKEEEIAALLIDAQGTGTHFFKEGTVRRVTPGWAALALFTLQINAPTGGRGHRVSLRGGGPLTTLILPPAGERNTLWHQIWLNILTQEQIESLADGPLSDDPAIIFPWLAPTRTSDNKGLETHPRDGHPCQMYWSMPRRIRLLFNSDQPGRCDLSGEQCDHLVARYRTRHSGINYAGGWRHPLTPYSVDPKKGALPIKAQPGGIGYRHWLGLIVADEKNQKQPAKVIQVYQNDNRRRVIGGDVQPGVWAFGYDMDNMKARCWYEATLPLFDIPKAQRAEIQRTTVLMVDAAAEVVKSLRNAVKQAWFSRPKDAKGDFAFLDSAFWGATESDFYRLLGESMNTLVQEQEPNLAPSLQKWRNSLREHGLTLFDYYALLDGNEDGDMRRVIKARSQLEKWLHIGKAIKRLAA